MYFETNGTDEIQVPHDHLERNYMRLHIFDETDKGLNLSRTFLGHLHVISCQKEVFFETFEMFKQVLLPNRWSIGDILC
jgi:hypothetical protein